jgi:hypothetical protein
MWMLIFWFCSISIASSFGFLIGTLMAKRKPIDTNAVANAKRHAFIVGWRAAVRSKPHLVLISPTETREVQSVESHYVSPDSNLLRSGGYQPRPGNHRPAVPKSGSGVTRGWK